MVLFEEGGDAPSDHDGVMADIDLDAVAIGRGRALPARHDAHLALWPEASP